MTQPEPADEVLHDEADVGSEPLRLTDAEEDDLVEAEAVVTPVSYSGQDFDVAGLVRRIENEDILVPVFGHSDDRIETAGFQRAFVWKKSQMDRFIESLLLGFPVPGIFLVRQTDRRYLVLDGQQRLRTLSFFYAGVFADRVFSLSNVADQFKGLTYDSLSEDQRRLLDDTFIPATIVSTTGSSDSLEAIYQIFERLNSGGTPLTAHEIRVALFAGPLIDFLDTLNQNPSWRAIYGAPSPRLRDQELLLRIVSLYLDGEHYRRPQKSFLNGFVARHRNLEDVDTGGIAELLSHASQLLLEAGGRQTLTWTGYQVNTALAEAIYVGLMRAIELGDPPSPEGIAGVIERLPDDPDFANAVERATADEESVRRRLSMTTAAFTAK